MRKEILANGVEVTLMEGCVLGDEGFIDSFPSVLAEFSIEMAIKHGLTKVFEKDDYIVYLSEEDYDYIIHSASFTGVSVDVVHDDVITDQYMIEHIKDMNEYANNIHSFIFICHDYEISRS